MKKFSEDYFDFDEAFVIDNGNEEFTYRKGGVSGCGVTPEDAYIAWLQNI